MKVLVFLEQRNGKLKSSALEALTVASKLGGGAENVFGIVLGPQAQTLAGEASTYGAGTIYVASDQGFDCYNPITYANAVQAALEASKAGLVLGMASPMGRDFFPRLAAKNDAGLATDLVEISHTDGTITGAKPMYAGKVLATVELGGSELKFVTLRPNVFAPALSSTTAAIVDLALTPEPISGFLTVDVRVGATDKADLTEATRIISGGRSLGSEENFKILHECAEVLQATVGASRAAVDSGFASHDMQVGQTGKTVNPQLYIACGISGAIQHMAGMRTSKIIVAINTDSDAPIFSIADYGIVGDLFEVVPALTKALQAKIGD